MTTLKIIHDIYIERIFAHSDFSSLTQSQKDIYINDDEGNRIIGTDYNRNNENKTRFATIYNNDSLYMICVINTQNNTSVILDKLNFFSNIDKANNSGVLSDILDKLVLLHGLMDTISIVRPVGDLYTSTSIQPSGWSYIQGSSTDRYFRNIIEI